jgi:hypothetical protein
MKSFDTDGANMHKAFFMYSITPKLDTAISYIYFDGIKTHKSVKELIIRWTDKNFVISGVGLRNNNEETVIKSTIEYKF